MSFLMLSDSQVRETLSDKVAALSPRYYPVIQVDHSYVDGRGGAAKDSLSP